jgi:hypothetical protein
MPWLPVVYLRLCAGCGSAITLNVPGADSVFCSRCKPPSGVASPESLAEMGREMDAWLDLASEPVG